MADGELPFSPIFFFFFFFKPFSWQKWCSLCFYVYGMPANVICENSVKVRPWIGKINLCMITDMLFDIHDDNWIHGDVFCFFYFFFLFFFSRFIFLGVYAVYTNSLQTHLFVKS